MPQESKMKRKLRRVRRELSIAHRMINFALDQRDQARMIAIALEKELKLRDTPTPNPDGSEPDGIPVEPSFTITRLSDEGETIEEISTGTAPVAENQ